MRIASNKLTIVPLGGGKYRLFGYIMAKVGERWTRTKIRQRSANLAELETEKKKLEADALAYELGMKNAMRVTHVRLTHEQQLDAEAAVLKLMPGRTLVECVEYTNRVLGTGAPVLFSDALTSWEDYMRKNDYQEPTLRDNLGRTGRFLKANAPKKLPDGSPVMLLQEATPEMVEAYVYRKGLEPYSRVGEAKVLKAFFNYCIKRKFLRQNPVELDVSAMTERAQPSTEPAVLSLDECQKLLDAAIGVQDGCMVPYVILSLWCFMRPSEVLRVQPENIQTRPNRKTGAPETIVHMRGKKKGSQWRDTIVPANVAPLLLRAVDAGQIKKRELGPKGNVVEAGGPFFSQRCWTKVRADAGIIEVLPPTKVGGYCTLRPGSRDWCPDMLRHTGLTYRYQQLRNAGESDREAADRATSEAGNSVKIAFKHYITLIEPDACDAFYAITASIAPAALANVVSISA